MTWMWNVAGLAAGLLTASAALAQSAAGELTPPAPASGAGAGLGSRPSAQVNVTIENDTSFSLFTQTLGAGQTCLRTGIPATSLAANTGQGFGLTSNGGCPAQGLQTFVLGTPAGEQRVNLPFSFDQNNARLGSGAGPGFVIVSNVAGGNGRFAGGWFVRCVWQGCPASDPVLTIQNATAEPLTVSLRPGAANCTGKSLAPWRSIPPGGADTLPVRPCQIFAYDVNQQGAFFVTVDQGRFKVDLAPGAGQPLAQRTDAAGAVVIVVGAATAR